MTELTTAQKAGVIASICELYGMAREQFHPAAEHLSDALAGYHLMDMLDVDVVRSRLVEIIR